ncbi:MAG TPA: FAD-binding protein, partial [Bryobacteraceae bacterium]|nr:FAD-binding protein [Bryobacteraceae bacterium]
MDTAQTPRTPQELAEALHSAASAGRTIQLEGAGSKRLMAGPAESAAALISTTALTRVLDYEPADLTISVEAGLPWCEFTRL